ncbi:hypothetical protein BH10PLA1_BH10PLA1_20380 [soil metagenome]
MQEDERRKLRHDTLGCLNSIKLCVEVIATTKDREELLMFLDCITQETSKIATIMDTLIAETADAAPDTMAHSN